MFTFSFFSLRFFLETGWCHYPALIVTPCFIDKTPFFVDFIFICFNYYLTLEYETN